MRRIRMSVVGVVGALALTLTATACSTDSLDTGGDTTAPDDLSDQRVGAMEDYDANTSFVATEPVQFGLLYRNHPNYPFDPQWSIVDQLETERNVTFDYVNVPLSDWQKRRSILLSAGDAPEIIPSTYVGDVEEYVPSGSILPISKYLDYMPHFTQKIQEWGLQEDLDRTRQADGNFYVLPGLLETPKPDYTIAIRADLWEQAGLSTSPETWAEFADQLEVIKETYPQVEYPMSDRWSLNGPMEATLQAAAGNFGTEAGWGYDGTFWNGSEYEYTGATEGYHDLVAYFADLVEQGLLDPESLTQDDDAAIAKFINGESAAIGSNSQEVVRYRTAMAEAGNDDAEIEQIVVPAGPAGNIMDASTGGRFESGIAFSSSAADQEDFVAMLQFIDWLYYSDEGLEFAQWGVEGETYTVDDSGDRTLIDGIGWNGVNPDAPKKLNVDFGYSNGVWMLAHGSTQDLLESMLRPEVVKFRQEMNNKEVAEAGPAIQLDELDREQASLRETALEDIAIQNTAAFILGERPMSEWDEYLSELKSAGMEEYMELINSSAAG